MVWFWCLGFGFEGNLDGPLVSKKTQTSSDYQKLSQNITFMFKTINGGRYQIQLHYGMIYHMLVYLKFGTNCQV